MALAPNAAERRVNLIREMARQRESTHSRSSAASSVGSAHDSVHDFDTASRPIHLNAAAHQHAGARDQHDFQIDTSTLRRSFPNFSQSGSSEEDSIEFGRGARRTSRNGLSQAPPSADTTDDNVVFTMNDGISYQVTATPPFYKGNASKKREGPAQEFLNRTSLQRRATSNKENQDPAVKMTELDWTDAKKSFKYNERQSLAEIHPDDVQGDGDIPLQSRPPAVPNATKSTRFGHGRNSKAIATADSLPKSFKSANTLQHTTGQALAEMTPQSQRGPNPRVNPTYSSGTYQSFILPDLPNLTELMSGEGLSGTPNLYRSTTSRSRFSSHVAKRQVRPDHLRVEGIPIPDDEKALYVSLQLLQEKVAELELEKAQSQQKFENYENEIIELKVKLQKREVSKEYDSGIGTDADEDRNRAWAGDRTKLELSIKRLQDRLEQANQKVSVSEITVQNLTKDRNDAHSRLAMAYRSSNELQSECEKVHQDIGKVKAQLKTMTKRHEKKIEKLTKQENELRDKLERRGKAVEEMSSLAKEIWSTRTALAATQDRRLRQPWRQDDRIHQKPIGDEISIPSCVEKPIVSHNEAPRTHIYHRASSKSLGNKTSQENESDADSTTNIQIGQGGLMVDWQQQQDLTKNPEFESFMEGDEVEKLRKILEDDRAKLAGLVALTEHKREKRDVTDANIATREHVVPLRRKSSLKNANKNTVRGKIIRDDVSLKDQLKLRRRSMEGSVQEKQAAQQSMKADTSEKRRRSAGPKAATDLTSAFFLQDVTLSNVERTSDNQDSKGAQLPSEPVKRTAIVSRPIPVSDRQVPATKADEDATLRPAQSPGQALAIVLHDLENEVAHLHAQLNAQEKLYNRHDPALERRKRQKVYNNIQKLLSAIEIRSERIYRLYDVLEGQKASGMLMTEAEIEITLHDIGIDAAVMLSHRVITQNHGLAASKLKKTVVIADEDLNDSDGASDESDSGDEEDDDMPWEGLDATQSLRSLPPPTLTLEHA